MIVDDRSANSGFSLVELVTVIVLLGIVAVVALGRFANQDSFAARGFFDDTVNAVRFAQKLAISSGCDVRVITTAGGYRLRQSSTCTADDFANPVVNPANRSTPYQNLNIPAGFSLDAGVITFDARGLPEEAMPPSFDLSDGGTSYSLKVHQSTGMVEVI